ncbi:MAG: MotA/TolQ/ExbB proton channel family protein, partial [Fulvivirga sp.]
MKKLFTLLALVGCLTLSYQSNAQDEAADSTSTEMADSSAVAEEPVVEETPAPVEEPEAVVEEEASFHQVIKDKFIEGDWKFMTPVLLCLIIGLAIAIERIITLNLATTNTDKLLATVEDALSKGGVEAAKEVTRNIKGPVASIFTQGLMRMSEG